MQVRGFACAALPIWLAAALTAAPPADPAVDVTVVNQSNQPIPGVRLQLKLGETAIASAETDPSGHAAFADVKPGRYNLTATKDGFVAAQKSDLDLSQSAGAAVEFTLVPVPAARQESVEVQGTAEPVEQGSSAPAELPAQTAKQLPSKPATVADVLQIGRASCRARV